MEGQAKALPSRAAPIFRSVAASANTNLIPSSSPAFGTPVHPIRRPDPTVQRTKPTILPVLLPPATLRPLAFRTFTKKHNFTLTSTALQALAAFIGKHCGSGWREEGLAEKVLEETAKIWKKNGGGLIVDGEGKEFQAILKSLEGSISGGRVIQQGTLSRQSSYSHHDLSCEASSVSLNGLGNALGRGDGQTSGDIFDEITNEEEQENQDRDPRQWLKVVGAFDQPRLAYNTDKKHFEKVPTTPSLFPNPSQKTHLFRHRYNLIHQRLLRNESFQTPTVSIAQVPSLQRSSSTIATPQQAYKLTPIANLLGRSGSNHILLGLLTISPTGTLAISDLTGSIALDLRHARPIPENGAWFTPGMIVIVEGIYEEEGSTAGAALGGGGGVGGTIGGKFIGWSVGGPPSERREVTLGISHASGEADGSSGGGFGWVDFLGVGSERATGSRMRKLEKSVFGRQPGETEPSDRSKMVVLGEVNLDNPKTIQAVRKILGIYAAQPAEDMPMTFILIGNFVQYAVMAGGGSGGSIEYKEYFNSLASTLSDYPSVLQAANFVFVPGDNDPWASSFSAGGATILPRKSIPELLTSRIKRAFATANAEVEKSLTSSMNGEAIWTSNPSRLTLFGPAQEIVVFRDDISGRLRRSALQFQPRHSTEAVGGEVPATTSGTASEQQRGGEEMEVDQALIAAESHMPTSKAPTNVTTSTTSNDVLTARKLVKTILDQGYLSPFPLSSRPVLWDYAGALQLYPLPTALVLMDPEAPPFAVTYEGCHAMNPGRLIAEERRGLARWMEYDAGTRRGKTREVMF